MGLIMQVEDLELQNVLETEEVAETPEENTTEEETEALEETPEFNDEPFEETTKESSEEEEAGVAIGIDLGTSNSVVSYYRDGKYNYIDISGKRLIPSAIYFKGKDESAWIYGDRALKRGVIYPDALFKHFKRHIGEEKEFSFHCEPHGEDLENAGRKYIIDTNIFIEDPAIIERIELPDEIVVPKTVYQELERRRSDSETSERAAAALASINQNEARVVFADSHMELLPEDWFQSDDRDNHDRNDSKIISVAYSMDDERTILLSNDYRKDNSVARKAEWLKAKFKVWNYEQFGFFSHIKDSSTSDELALTGKDGAVIFLKYLREEVRKRIGLVSKAIITVPQTFSPIQHNEIKEAGLSAGFSEVELRSEPMAAAVAYGLDQKDDKKLLIYDFGGGTFDVTIFRISENEFEPLAADGDPNLGGEDFTQAVIDDFKDKLLEGEILPDGTEFDMTDEEASGLSHEEFMKNEMKIWEACEDMKCRLSTSDSEQKSIPLYLSPGERKDVDYELSRDEFDALTAELRGRARKKLDAVLQQAGLTRDDINVVIVAGGTSTIPSVVESVERYFGKKVYSDRDPATLIAEGAALYADMLWNQDSTIEKKIKIFDKTMNDFGVSVRTKKGQRAFDCVIPTGATLPMQQEKKYSLVKDNQTALDIECFTRDAGNTSTHIPASDESIRYIGRVQISKLPPLKRDEVDVAVVFRLTKEYTLQVDVNLFDKQGNLIEQTTASIETIGV